MISRGEPLGQIERKNNFLDNFYIILFIIKQIKCFKKVLCTYMTYVKAMIVAILGILRKEKVLLFYSLKVTYKAFKILVNRQSVKYTIFSHGCYWSHQTSWDHIRYLFISLFLLVNISLQQIAFRSNVILMVKKKESVEFFILLSRNRDNALVYNQIQLQFYPFQRVPPIPKHRYPTRPLVFGS